jgi:hypothetical protein
VCVQRGTARVHRVAQHVWGSTHSQSEPVTAAATSACVSSMRVEHACSSHCPSPSLPALREPKPAVTALQSTVTAARERRNPLGASARRQPEARPPCCSDEPADTCVCLPRHAPCVCGVWAFLRRLREAHT